MTTTALQNINVSFTPTSFAGLVTMGAALVKTGFLPAHIRTGEQLAAIVLTGAELGMDPMRSLRCLTMVKGKVVEAADSQLARFKRDGGRASFVRLDDKAATLKLRHPNGDEHEETFTLDDAKKAGLLSSGMYDKFPRAMLRSRVITAGLKSVGWDGAVGAYDPDEVQHFAPETRTVEHAPTTPLIEAVAPPAPTTKQDRAVIWAHGYLARLFDCEDMADVKALMASCEMRGERPVSVEVQREAVGKVDERLEIALSALEDGVFHRMGNPLIEPDDRAPDAIKWFDGECARLNLGGAK